MSSSHTHTHQQQMVKMGKAVLSKMDHITLTTPRMRQDAEKQRFVERTLTSCDFDALKETMDIDLKTHKINQDCSITKEECITSLINEFIHMVYSRIFISQDYNCSVVDSIDHIDLKTIKEAKKQMDGFWELLVDRLGAICIDITLDKRTDNIKSTRFECGWWLNVHKVRNLY